MDFALDKNKVNMSGDAIVRRAGYGFIHDQRSGKDSYMRRLTGDYYPRFHLDQKRASYQGNHMHNAEYDGPLVVGEVERLKQVVIGLIDQQQAANRPKEKEEEKSPWYKFW